MKACAFFMLLFMAGCSTPPTATDLQQELRKSLQVVCLDGNSYYYGKWYEGGGSVWLSYSVLAPKFDKDGKPVRCVEENKVLDSK